MQIAYYPLHIANQAVANTLWVFSPARCASFLRIAQLFSTLHKLNFLPFCRPNLTLVSSWKVQIWMLTFKFHRSHSILMHRTPYMIEIPHKDHVVINTPFSCSFTLFSICYQCNVLDVYARRDNQISLFKSITRPESRLVR